MKKVVCIILIFLSIALMECAIPNENTVETVDITATNNSIVIKNLTTQPIYYIAIEQQFLAVVDWIPTFNGPSVNNGQSTELSYDKVLKSEGKVLGPGDKVIIYWWTNENGSPSKLSYYIVGL